MLERCRRCQAKPRAQSDTSRKEHLPDDRVMMNRVADGEGDFAPDTRSRRDQRATPIDLGFH